MPELVDNLADLTSQKDRDALELALVGTIKDLLAPLSVAIYRGVGDRDNQRWLTCARLGAGEVIPSMDSAWANIDTLPKLAEFPLRLQAIATQLVSEQASQPNRTVFPLAWNLDAPGVLEIETQTTLTEESRRLVTGVLRLYRNFQSLLDYGERDTLTELLNRKTFDGAFLKATIEQNRATSTDLGERRHETVSSSYWLAMIDIDHFKRVNDTYGHLIGDEVLLLLARLMRACFRFHDQLYRFGGEEFVVLMRCNGEAEAALALERLRTSTAGHLFPQVGHITISVGFTEVRPGDTPSGAFERADKAVYHAKAHGRDQVCSHSALVAQGKLAEQVANVGDVELF
ncbi:GGDEF domain-containing protein, partial [Rhodoferax sp.]|uniref:GGDEF domain-containing protein n=1 Tax=Rhodoferax sp. TaxID=50421 RepID=UPI002765D85B|nr:GGDEF domain-containing protein [Rhodoferax sp.]